MGSKLNRVGEKYVTNEGYDIEIIKYFGDQNCSIQFNDGTILNNREFGCIRKGSIKNPNHKSVFGIGYLGQGNFKSKINKKTTKVYNTWQGMLERCYDEKRLSKFPSYVGCSVYTNWHNFQVFAEWFEENYIDDWHLDKDVLVKNNKIYSPSTCCFIPADINTLFVKCNKKRGSLPIGVTLFNKGKFCASINKNKKRKYLGQFNTPELAFLIYKEAKEEYIQELADKYSYELKEEVYEALYSYKVEITD